MPPRRRTDRDPSEDRELLLRAAAGDSAAFETLFARHRDGLQAFLLRRLRSQAEAEDALSLTFFKAWRARATFRGQTTGKVWLYQIANRVVLDTLRRYRLDARKLEVETREYQVMPPGAGHCVDPLTAMLTDERVTSTRRAVRDACRRLSPQQRELLDLYYFDGRSYQEISSLLGIPYTQVRGRLHRIRGLLRRDLVNRQQFQLA